MKQAHVYFSGYVQGVGFRQFVKSEAKKHDIHGWVRNLPARNATHSVAGRPDGRVEAVFQGEKNAIEQLIVLCKRGPFLAEVKDISVTWEEVEKQFTDFQIS